MTSPLDCLAALRTGAPPAPIPIDIQGGWSWPEFWYSLTSGLVAAIVGGGALIGVYLMTRRHERADEDRRDRAAVVAETLQTILEALAVYRAAGTEWHEGFDTWRTVTANAMSILMARAMVFDPSWGKWLQEEVLRFRRATRGQDPADIQRALDELGQFLGQITEWSRGGQVAPTGSFFSIPDSS